MLNKEMLLGGASKKNGPVIMTVGKRTMTASTGPSTDVFGFSKADSIGAINVTPYWWINREKARLLSLTATYLSGSSAAWGTFSDIRGEEESSAEPLLEITITANGRTGKITIPTTSSTALMSYANDVFALRSLVGQQVKLAFAPPQTDICRISRHLSNGGGVNVRKRSLAVYAKKKGANAEHTQWMGWRDGDYVFQKQDIYELERFRFSVSGSQNSHFIAGGGKCDLRRRSVGGLRANVEECQNGRRFCFALLLHHRPDQRCRNPLVVSCFEGGANA